MQGITLKIYISIAILFIGLLIVVIPPFVTTHKILTAISQEDTTVLDAYTDLEAVKSDLKSDFIGFSQLLLTIKDSKISGQDAFALETANKLLSSITDTASLLTKMPFLMLTYRADVADWSLRYIRHDRLEIKLSDTDRPFILPNLLICSYGILDWKLCGVNVSNEWYVLSAPKVHDEKMFDTDKKLEKIIKHVSVSNLKRVMDEQKVITFNEFFSVINHAYTPRKSTLTDKPFQISLVTKEGNTLLITPKSAYLIDQDDTISYRIFYNSLQVEGDDSFAECHACPGSLSAITFTYKDGFKDFKRTDQLTQVGVWGDVGQVLEIGDYDDEKLVIYNGSCWQGECHDWMDVYKIQSEPAGVKLISLPDESFSGEKDH